MNICVFIKKSPLGEQLGGMEIQNNILVEGLRRLDHEVTLIETSHPAGTKESLDKFISLHEQNPFDIVVSQSAAGTFYIKNSDFDLPFIVIQHGTLLGEIKTRFREISGIKDFLYFIFRLIPYAFKAYFVYDLKRLTKANVIIAVSDQVESALVRQYPFIDDKKIKVIFNGVDLERFKVKRKNKIDKVGFIFVGKLFRSKGIHVLLKAVKILKDKGREFSLTIVGDGPEFESLKSQSDYLSISDTAEFIGSVPNDEVQAYYSKSDVFVLPTLRDEGFPVTLVEAQASGLAIIASNIGGIPSGVKEGMNGRLVDPNDVEDLAMVLEEFIEDTDNVKKMGEVSRKWAEDKLSVKSMVESYSNIFRTYL